MAEIGTNPSKDTLVGSVAGYDLHTLTEAGASYVIKKIHPPAPTPMSYCGRPSIMSQEICTFETPGETDIRPILIENRSNSAANPDLVYNYPDTMLFLNLPGGVVSQYVFMKAGDDTFVQQTGINMPTGVALQAPVCLNAGFDWRNNYSREVGSHLLDYKSVTTYCNATNFNNQGLISTSKFKPDIIFNTVENFALTLDEKSKANLYAATGHQPRNKRNNHDDFEVIDSVGAPNTQAKFQFLNFGTQEATVTDQYGMKYIKGLFPQNIGEIQAMSRNNATRPFKEGAFDVSRDARETQDLINRPLLTSTALEGQNLLGTLICWYNPLTFQTYYVRLIASIDYNINNMFSKACDIPWSDTTGSFTLIQGMSVPTTESAVVSLNNLPYASIKTINGWMVQPSPRSSLNVFNKELPLPDQASINMIATINRNRPDSLPASENDFASIASTLLSLAPSVISILTTLFGKKNEKKERGAISSVRATPSFVPPNTNTRAIASGMRAMSIRSKPKNKKKPNNNQYVANNNNNNSNKNKNKPKNVSIKGKMISK